MNEVEYPEIKYGVPIPKDRPMTKWRIVAEKMPVGSFVDVNGINHAKAMIHALWKWGMRGTRKNIGDGKYRVWRIS